MGFYNDQVVPRAIDKLLGGRGFDTLRAEVCAGLSGEVVEVGFGSGLNVPHYPVEIDRVRAVDPATVGRKLAAKHLANSSVPVEFVGLDGESLPIPDNSVDGVIVTWTLCTIPDVHAGMAEIERVLKPGGKFRFVEHGLAPDKGVSSWQRRLTPVQKKVAGGCHLDREIDDLVTETGLEITSLSKAYLGWPKALSFMYMGEAVKHG